MNNESLDYWIEKDFKDRNLNLINRDDSLLESIKYGYHLGFRRAEDIWYNKDYICDRCGVILKEMDNPNKILIETLEKLSRFGHEPMLGNSNGNVIAQKGLAKYYEALNNPNTIEDGYGNSWDKKCCSCKKDTMQVVKPGKVQCCKCG